MAETLRLFVAVELPEPAKRYVEEVIGLLRQQRLPGIRWVRPDGVHLTLKVLGQVPEVQIPPVVEAMEKAAAGTAPFSLWVQGVGAFPGLHKPQVLWLGVQGDLDQMAQVQGKMEDILERQGFAREGRPFSPHLTLGRVKGRVSPSELEKLRRVADGVSKLGWVELPVSSLSLMESLLFRNGAIYRRKAQITLGNALADPPRP